MSINGGEPPDFQGTLEIPANQGMIGDEYHPGIISSVSFVTHVYHLPWTQRSRSTGLMENALRTGRIEANTVTSANRMPTKSASGSSNVLTPYTTPERTLESPSAPRRPIRKPLTIRTTAC